MIDLKKSIMLIFPKKNNKKIIFQKKINQNLKKNEKNNNEKIIFEKKIPRLYVTLVFILKVDQSRLRKSMSSHPGFVDLRIDPFSVGVYNDSNGFIEIILEIWHKPGL